MSAGDGNRLGLRTRDGHLRTVDDQGSPGETFRRAVEAALQGAPRGISGQAALLDMERALALEQDETGLIDLRYGRRGTEAEAAVGPAERHGGAAQFEAEGETGEAAVLAGPGAPGGGLPGQPRVHLALGPSADPEPRAGPAQHDDGEEDIGKEEPDPSAAFHLTGGRVRGPAPTVHPLRHARRPSEGRVIRPAALSRLPVAAQGFWTRAPRARAPGRKGRVRPAAVRLYPGGDPPR